MGFLLLRWGNKCPRRAAMTKPVCSRIILAAKLVPFFLWNIAFSVAYAIWKKPFLSIAVIDYFDVAIIPNFCHEKFLRFSAFRRDAKVYKLVIKGPAYFYSMHTEFSRLCQIAKLSNYLSDHVVISHCYEKCGLSEC